MITIWKIVAKPLKHELSIKSGSKKVKQSEYIKEDKEITT